jgi:hypothetical protein
MEDYITKWKRGKMLFKSFSSLADNRLHDRNR